MGKSKIYLRRYLLILSVVVLVFATQYNAFARAGSDPSSSSSSSSLGYYSHNHYRNDDYDGSTVSAKNDPAIMYQASAFFAVVALILLWGVWYGYKMKKLVVAKGSQCAKLLQKLSSNDCEWEQDLLVGRIKNVFYKVQQAWMERDQEIAKSFMSESLFFKHKAETDEMLLKHEKNIIKDIDLAKIVIIGVSKYLDKCKDKVTAYLSFEMIDYTVDDRTERLLAGDNTMPKKYEELWAFVHGEVGWVVDKIETKVSLGIVNSLKSISE